MRRKFFVWLASVAMLSGYGSFAQAAVQNRIVSSAGRTAAVLPQSVSPKTTKATDMGAADGAASLPSITLHFNMTIAQTAALTQLLTDQQNPASARYHQWLTPEQFADQFGLSAADVATVSQWATGQGFKIVSVARTRTFIQFSGTVAQAQAAFQTSIHKVSLSGEQHIANVSAVSLPAGIATVVEGVSGLNDFRVKPRVKVRQVQPKTTANPAFTSSVTGDTYMAPGDFYTIYDVAPLLSSSINGTGISIAVAGQTDILLSDIASFRSASGLSANVPTVMLYGKDPGTPTTNGVADDETEADLDVEWSGAVAPSATIIYANSTDVFNSLTQIVDNKLAPIASISYGDCESGIGQPDLNTLNAVLMMANSEGITVVGPGGDDGATDCDYQETTATQGLAVDFPASSPYATGVGGTEFNEGSGTYWNTTNTPAGEGSALSYIPENVWNTTAADGELSAGGGGVSAYFSKPTWQIGTGVPSDGSRDVPDVALNADPDHDGYLFCTQGSCVVGFRASTNGTLSVVGGTSASTPSFAGILALVEQKIGTSIGNANPVIYALANSTYYNNVFHDVTVGNNESPCKAGSTDCPLGGDIGYTAGVGYDLTSGWGSVNAFNLANCWSVGSSGGTCADSATAPDFTLTPATTTVTAAAGANAPGLVYTVTPVNGFTGPVAFTASSTSSSLNATYSFTVTPVEITTAAAGTTTLDLLAYELPDAKSGTGLARHAIGLALVRKPEQPGAKRGTEWYAGSGAALACMVLLMVPRRRRIGALLGIVVSVVALGGMFGLQGCGNGTNNVTTQLNAMPGTYTIIVTATGTSSGTTVSHNATVTFVVQ